MDGIFIDTPTKDTIDDTTIMVGVTRNKNPEIFWIVKYLISEGFPKEHLNALCKIVGLFNDCEESEREIFEFTDQLYKKYTE